MRIAIFAIRTQHYSRPDADAAFNACTLLLEFTDTELLVLTTCNLFIMNNFFSFADFRKTQKDP